MNCPEFFFKTPVGGGSFMGQHFKISWTAEKIDKFFEPHGGELGRQGRMGPSEAG